MLELTNEKAAEILEEHRRFFARNKTKDLNFRLQQLQKLRAAIKKYETKILEALEKDLGKHSFEAFTTEVGFTLNSITHTMKRLKKWAKPKKVYTYRFVSGEEYGGVRAIWN